MLQVGKGERGKRGKDHTESAGGILKGEKREKGKCTFGEKGGFRAEAKERKKKKPQEIAIQQPHFFFSAAAASEEPWLMTTVVPVGSATVSLPATGVRALLR